MARPNEEMALLGSDDDSPSLASSPRPSPPAPEKSPAESAGIDSAKIQKVAGGYEVSVMCPSLESAHALQKQLMEGGAPEKPAEPEPEGESSSSSENVEGSEGARGDYVAEEP